MGDMGRYPISRWWGWGDIEKTYSLADRPNFLPFLKKELNLTRFRECPPPSLDELTLPEPRLEPAVIDDLSGMLGAYGVSVSKEDRLRHAVGRSYRDLLALRLDQVVHAPDVVVFPQNENQVQKLLEFAAARDLCLVPVGGATSVVGGVEPLKSEHCTGVISMNLTRMAEVLAVDDTSLLARVQPGIYGGVLEKHLNGRGLSLGHFPESFHYSTVGGWTAATSAGQNSTLYGRMADLVLGLRMATPVGILDTGTFPAHAQGPDLKHLAIGSEGIFGIITEARLKLHPLPQRSDFAAVLFPSFLQGVEAARLMMRAGLSPAVLRLSNGPETDMALALAHQPRHGPLKVLVSKFFNYLSKKGYHAGKRSLMILGFEGRDRIVRAQKREALRLARPLDRFYLGKKAGAMWVRNRFDQPYLRDTLMNMGLLVDTLETVVPWSNVSNLYENVSRAIRETLTGLGTPGLVLAHLSHLYPQGSSIYFIIICPQREGREMEQWQGIKESATTAIVKHGGAVSHHHGVGLDHAPWMERALGDSTLDILKRIKSAMDPKGVMNPGKLFPGE